METQSGAGAGHKTIVERTREAMAGMQTVEREIIDQLRNGGTQVTAANFTWNNGRSLAELPADLIHLEVRVGSRRVSADLPRVHLEDSHDRIDRWEVRLQIERIIKELMPPVPGV
jgi:hypothetical protein